VQRSWSNREAIAGHNPCVPVDGNPYFLAVGQGDDALALFDGVLTHETRGWQVAAGATRTIDVQLHGEDGAGQWSVFAFDFTPFMHQPGSLALSVSPRSGQDGDTIQLTIKPN